MVARESDVFAGSSIEHTVWAADAPVANLCGGQLELRYSFATRVIASEPSSNAPSPNNSSFTRPGGPMTKPVPLDDLRPEWRLLLQLSRLSLDQGECDVIRNELESNEDNLDWGQIVDQAARHRVLPLIAHNLDHYDLRRHTLNGHTLLPYWWLFAGIVRINRERNIVLENEYGRVLRALNFANIAYAVRKGPALSRLYPDGALRVTNDLDLLVAAEDLKKVSSAMTSIGYSEGRPSQDGYSVQEFDRRTKVFWQTQMVVRLPFTRITRTSGVDQYTVEPTTSILYAAKGKQPDTRSILERAARVHMCGNSACVLSWVDQLIDISVHIYEEAISLHYIRRGKDIRLQKYVDVVAIIRSNTRSELWTSFIKRTTDFEVSREVYYALHHAAILYPNVVPDQVLDELRPNSLDYLDEFGALDASPLRWRGGFVERMFSNGRKDQASNSRIPMD